MRFENPEIVDHGSIAEHTFTRCGNADPTSFMGINPPPKDKDNFRLDKFGECSDPGVS